jgi:hypothetical protein
VIGALGVVSKKFEGFMKECDDTIRLEVMQKTTLLGTIFEQETLWLSK